MLMVFVALLGGLIGSQPAAAAEPYHLGVALGMTGPGALYSKDQVEGITLAVEEINAKGGLLGRHPIRLFTHGAGEARSEPRFHEFRNLRRNNEEGVCLEAE